MHNYVVSYGSLFSHQNRPCFLGYNPPFKDICVVGYSPAQKSGFSKIFFFLKEGSFAHNGCMHLFDQRYSKNSSCVKYYYHFIYCFQF